MGFCRVLEVRWVAPPISYGWATVGVRPDGGPCSHWQDVFTAGKPVRHTRSHAMTTLTAIRPTDTTSTLGEPIAVRAEALLPRIRAAMADADTRRTLDSGLATALEDGGWFRMIVPPPFGGAPEPFPEVLRAIELLATADASVAWNVMVSCSVPALSALVSEEAGAAFYSGRGFPIASFARPGIARSEAGGYQVTANWGFLSGYDQCNYVGGICLVYDGDSPRLNPDGSPTIIIPFVPKAATRSLDTWHTTGLRGTGSTDVTVDATFVAASFVIDFAKGPRPDLGPLYYLPENIPGPCAAAALAVGIARGAIDTFARYAAGKQNPDGISMSSRPHVRRAIADAEIRQRQARAALFEFVDAVWAEALDGKMPDERRTDIGQLTAVGAVQGAVAAVDMVFAAAATGGIYEGRGLDRAFRDIHTLAAHIMVQESNLDRLGSALVLRD